MNEIDEIHKIDKIQEGGKFVPTSGFYFLFYGQNQLPKINNKNEKMNSFTKNLMIDEELKDNIKNIKNDTNINNIIQNIKNFNNIYKDKINSDNKVIILKFLYYIFYLVNVYEKKSNNKKSKKYITNRLIYNELFDKFNINIEDLIKNISVNNDDNKHFNLKIDMNIKNIFLFDENTTKLYFNKYKEKIIFLIKFLSKIILMKKNIIIEKNLFCNKNMNIIDLIEYKDKIYEFNKSYIPSYNSIVQELMLSYIIANNSDLMKMCIVETHMFNLAIKKVMGSETLKNYGKKRI